MVNKLTEDDVRTRRLADCVKSFPRAETGEYDPSCCRFPKACSPYGYMEAAEAGNLTEADLEPPRKSVADAMLETGLHTEKKILEPLRIGQTFAIETKLLDKLVPGDRQAAMDYEMARQRIELTTYVLAEKLADEDYIDKRSTSMPATWWDMFKLTYAMTWWLGWVVRRWPVKYDYHWFDVGVRVERYAKYPEANIAVPDLGRPVPYERVTRLSQLEIDAIKNQRKEQ